MLHINDLTYRIEGRTIFDKATVGIPAGHKVGFVGRNGSGKTTLLKLMARLLDPARGTVTLTGDARAAYVPQNPNSLLFEPTVRREVEETLKLLGTRDDGDVDRWLDALGLHDLAARHPRSLSGGERQRIAIAAVAVGGAPVLLLDEPTRGMDASSRLALDRAVRLHAEAGGAVVLATHDVELAATVTDRTVVLADGEVVSDGPSREVVVSSPAFAPQVAKVLAPLPWLTVAEVAASLRAG